MEQINAERPNKLYYSIKEVAQMMNVAETVFPSLKPKTNQNRVRQYTKKDIEQVRLIYNLVKVRGFKIAAAKKMLQQNRDGSERTQQVLESLINVRDELKDIKKHLESLT